MFFLVYKCSFSWWKMESPFSAGPSYPWKDGSNHLVFGRCLVTTFSVLAGNSLILITKSLDIDQSHLPISLCPCSSQEVSMLNIRINQTRDIHPRRQYSLNTCSLLGPSMGGESYMRLHLLMIYLGTFLVFHPLFGIFKNSSRST